MVSCSFYALHGACWFCIMSRPLSFAMQCFCSCNAALFVFASHHITLSFCATKLCVFAVHCAALSFCRVVLFLFAAWHYFFMQCSTLCCASHCSLFPARLANVPLAFCKTPMTMTVRYLGSPRVGGRIVKQLATCLSCGMTLAMGLAIIMLLLVDEGSTMLSTNILPSILLATHQRCIPKNLVPHHARPDFRINPMFLPRFSIPSHYLLHSLPPQTLHHTHFPDWWRRTMIGFGW